MATEIISRLRTVSTTKACAAAGNYDAEDVISQSATEGTAWTFTNVVDREGQSGVIVMAEVLCETTALTHKLSLYLYNATPTCVLNDNVANTGVLHADAAKYIGRIDFPALEDLGGDSEAVATPSTYGNLPLAFVTATASRSIYGVLVTRDAITGETATDDYIIRLTVEQATKV